MAEDKKCKVHNCTRYADIKTTELCRTHNDSYKYHKKNMTVDQYIVYRKEKELYATKDACIIPNCGESNTVAKGLCRNHYRRVNYIINKDWKYPVTFEKALLFVIDKESRKYRKLV